jgi:hypothetical protein
MLAECSVDELEEARQTGVEQHPMPVSHPSSSNALLLGSEHALWSLALDAIRAGSLSHFSE